MVTKKKHQTIINAYRVFVVFCKPILTMFIIPNEDFVFCKPILAMFILTQRRIQNSEAPHTHLFTTPREKRVKRDLATEQPQPRLPGSSANELPTPVIK